jgi:hypothetical protein
MEIMYKSLNRAYAFFRQAFGLLFNDSHDNVPDFKSKLADLQSYAWLFYCFARGAFL